MIESCKINVQSMCEKTGVVPPPMPVISPVGTVSFLSMIINTIECRRANNHHFMFDLFVQHNSRAASHDPPASTSANPPDGSQTPQP